ncbi:NAD-dependent epimerase/dehydratase family protein [Paenibacillus albidus]|uniref:NAD-dependent epimerase/dehydratase family protein n=1 Tax=Paenibacillus albidus TaxID=2041023 RepID=UPI001BEBDAFB|nr:NAD-dependent epimerase/dehydratase family protein [Paenibacillus albidus]MBT2293110.1 NAD-dependent epimerase/dehydratase family protein [Paenibacillus albidus]
MRKILIMGGTRFFGKRLVEQLLEETDNEVTILTRGETADPFGERVERLHADRTDAGALALAVGHTRWDVVYDNICYSPDEAAEACRIFAGTTERYIFTSSLSVYDFSSEALTEVLFDPETYPVQAGGKADFSYAEAKRQAEAVFMQQAEFPVAAVRFPIVLGTDDYTQRLHFHIKHVRKGQPVGLPNPDAAISFIRSDEAAGFLYKLGCSRLTGPVNACSDGTVTIRELIAMIEQETGQAAQMHKVTPDEHMSPFGIEQSWFMDTAKARSHGFRFLKLGEWLPELIHELNSSID